MQYLSFENVSKLFTITYIFFSDLTTFIYKNFLLKIFKIFSVNCRKTRYLIESEI